MRCVCGHTLKCAIKFYLPFFFFLKNKNDRDKNLLFGSFVPPRTQKSSFSAAKQGNDRRLRFIFTLRLKQEEGEEGEVSEGQNKNLIGPCFLRLDGEGWRIYSCLASPPTTHCVSLSCSPPRFPPSPREPACPGTLYFRGVVRSRIYFYSCVRTRNHLVVFHNCGALFLYW